MEDAMILNKSSHERGFAHGSNYKAQFLKLEPKTREAQQSSQQFGKFDCLFCSFVFPDTFHLPFPTFLFSQFNHCPFHNNYVA